MLFGEFINISVNTPLGRGSRFLLGPSAYFQGLLLLNFRWVFYSIYLYIYIPGTPNNHFVTDVWLNNHFPCEDLVHHSIDSQPCRFKWMNFRFQVHCIWVGKKCCFTSVFQHVFFRDCWSLSETAISLFQSDIGQFNTKGMQIKYMSFPTTLCPAVVSRECVQESSSFKSIGTYVVN